MSLNCPQCRDLQRIAIEASKAYHEFLANLEAAHIRHDSEALLTLSAHLERASKLRDAAITGLTNHESTHAEETPTKAWMKSA